MRRLAVRSTENLKGKQLSAVVDESHVATRLAARQAGVYDIPRITASQLYPPIILSESVYIPIPTVVQLNVYQSSFSIDMVLHQRSMQL